MARCKECGQDFAVTPEEQRLIVTKKMEELCMGCAMQQYQENADTFVASPPLVPRKQALQPGPKRVLWEDPKGKLIAFMAIQPPKLYPAQMLHRLQKPGRLHPFVFQPAPSRQPSEPTLLIYTNIDRFQANREDFWVKKVPDACDPFTGVGSISIPFEKILVAELFPEKKTVSMKDGSCVKISYVW